MKYIKDIIISTKEPPINNVAWLQPQANNTHKLFIYGNNGWSAITSTPENTISTKFIKDIPDIIINK